MNYLAHAYFSYRDPELLVGNMISDFVKGKSKFTYPPRILEGIMLHRSIDGYTDLHPATRIIKTLYRSSYGHYGGVFADIIYDHFLANDPSVFSEKELADFSLWVYETLDKYHQLLPERFQQLFSYMRRDNWLFHYREKWGIRKSFGGIVHRAKYLTESDTAFELFEAHYDELKQAYTTFYPGLIDHLSQYFPFTDR
jgi:acyl carrier protein phosphodiesterase